MPLLSALFYYPVKSFPAIALEKVDLIKGEGLPNDRRFAITNGISNTLGGDWLTCRSFFINSVNDGLLKFAIEIQGETVRITSPEGVSLSFQCGNSLSLSTANRRLADFVISLGGDLQVPAPVITERRQVKGNLSGYWDFTDSAVSIMNRASLEAIATAAGQPLDIRRLRGNLIVEDLPAWEEFAWLGKRIKIGDAELAIIRPAKRCPATSVNPQTGERDIKVPDAMTEHFGHAFCGMYARVMKSGEIRPGSEINIIGNADLTLEDAAIAPAPDYKLWPKMAEVTSYETMHSGAEISIRSSGPWSLPEATKDQRLRFHLGQDLIGTANVIDHRDHTSTLHVEPSATNDPATAYLLEKVKAGDRLIVSGPFGRG